MLRLTADDFLSSPLVFQRAVAIRSKSTRRGYPVGFIALTCWVSAKNLMQSLRTLRKCWRIASPVRVGADGGTTSDVLDVSRASEMRSHQRCLILMVKSVAVCPFPTIGFSDAIENALHAHKLSIYVHPLPEPMISKSGRLAGRPSVSPCGNQPVTSCAWCSKKSCHSHGEARKSAGFGSRKERAAGTPKAIVLCIRLVCSSKTSVYSLFQLELLVGT
jgi:hypothetical protein